MDKQQAIEHLKALVPPGTTVFTILRAVSRSGMSRKIDLYVIQENQPYWLSGMVGAVTGTRQDRAGSLVVRGAGMDMGYHVVSNLAYELYETEYSLHQRWM